MKRKPSLSAALLPLLLGACDAAPPQNAATPARHPETVAAGSADIVRRHDPEQVARGLAVYQRHCANCHGVAGRGQPGDWRVRDPAGYTPPPPRHDNAHAWHHPTAVLLDVVRNGSLPGEGKMPPLKGTLSEAEIEDVLEYIKSLWSDPVYRLWWTLEQQSLED
jgi:mono/diheme cytochrome c family protein